MLGMRPMRTPRTLWRTLALVLVLLSASCLRPTKAASNVPVVSVAPAAGLPLPVLRFDHLGYASGRNSFAVLVMQAPAALTYELVDGNGAAAGDGTAGPPLLDTTSRAGARLVAERVDLSALEKPGQYFVVLGDGTRLGPITIDRDADRAILPAMIAFLRAQRCGPVDARASLHPPCHLYASITDGDPHTGSGDGIAVDDGFDGKVEDGSGTAVDVEGGWHDAGDYVKFVGTTAFVLSVDLMALRDHRKALVDAYGADTVTDLDAELRWGLDWLARMVAGPDGALYHQVSGEPDHDVDWRSPDKDTLSPLPSYRERPVFRFAQGHGANLLGRAAAAFALASLEYADDGDYSARMAGYARQALAAAQARPLPQEPDPADFYPEDSVDDDVALGAALLYDATGDEEYRQMAIARARVLAPNPGDPLYWGGVDALALRETARACLRDSPEQKELLDALGQLAKPIAATVSTPVGPGGAFGYDLPAFGNGSIEESLGAASACLAAHDAIHDLTADDDCVTVARAQVHWLLGENPFGLSYLVGVGPPFVQNLHHALARATGISLNGALAGGPTALAELTDAGLAPPSATDAFAASSTDSLLYEDNADDYVVNEPAVDFTAPLLFVLAELAAVDQP
jgi:hypothetical protein